MVSTTASLHDLMEHTDIQLKTLKTKLPKIIFVFQTFEGQVTQNVNTVFL